MSLSSSASTARALRPSLAVMVVWPSRCSMSSSSCRLTALSSTTSTRPAPGCGAVLPSARARKAMATALNCASRAGSWPQPRPGRCPRRASRPGHCPTRAQARRGWRWWTSTCARRAGRLLDLPWRGLRATTKGGPTPPSHRSRSGPPGLRVPTDRRAERVEGWIIDCSDVAHDAAWAATAMPARRIAALSSSGRMGLVT